MLQQNDMHVKHAAKKPKVLSVFSLVMINVIAVDSLRTLPLSALLGPSLVFYYVLAAVAFFIPVALISAELATAFPNTGGLYLWVREAFGRRAAFITIWLQWIYNIIWYPTMLTFIATTMAYLIAPHLATDKNQMLILSITMFWLFTLLNCFGMRISSLISVIGASIGTLLPMIGIIILGFMWFFQGKPIAVNYPANWMPDFSSLSSMSLFSGILFGLIGMEMSAFHAEEVKNPQRDYPRALFISTITIISTLTLGSLAIIMVIPHDKLDVVSGFIVAYDHFFKSLGLPWMTKVIAGMISLGGLSGVAAWIIGPTKGLLVAARDGLIHARYARVNRHGSPVVILVVQGVIFTLLCSLFAMYDSIKTAYWILSDMSAQLALVVYILMFASAIKLRYSMPDHPRAYRVPGGNIGMWIVCLSGIIICLFAMFIGFIPPEQIPVGNVYVFESLLILGLVVFLLIPWYFSGRKQDFN